MTKLSLLFVAVIFIFSCNNNSSEKKSPAWEPGKTTIVALIKNPDSTSTPSLVERYIILNQDSSIKSEKLVKDTAFVIYVDVPKYDTATKKQAVDTSGKLVYEKYQKRLARDSVMVEGFEGKDISKLCAKGGW